MEARRRPALVLGVETQIGLALVRELGRSGVPVVAISHDPCAIGLVSRHVWRRVVCGPPRSAAVVKLIRALGNELGPVSLLTVSEVNLAWINSVRDQLGEAVRPAVPPERLLRQVLDKSRTLEVARSVGIDTPITVQVRSMSELHQTLNDLPFPVILKWNDPNAVAPRLATLGLPLVKAEYALDAQSLVAAARRYETLGKWPMIQQYCPGVGLGQFFFMRDGLPVRRFQHVRVAEWPPEGGYSAVCDAVPLEQHTELQARSVALLQALQWEGPAMVEYRFDASTQRAVLMEINGRFWGSLPLAVACGAGFALHAHAAALGEPTPDLPAPRSDLRCRMMVAEVKRLVRIVVQPRRILDPSFRRRPWAELVRFVADFVRPNRCFYVASMTDWRPLSRDLANAIARRGQ